MRIDPVGFRFRVLLAGALTAFAGGPLVAATYTWTGATSANWSVGTNWMGGTAPSAADTNAVLVFPGNAANRNNNNDVSGLVVSSITIMGPITNPGPSYVINGNALSL